MRVALLALLLAGCSTLGTTPQMIYLQHDVGPCVGPAGFYPVHRSGEVCAWRDGKMCIVQTPRKTLFSEIGAAVRACSK